MTLASLGHTLNVMTLGGLALASEFWWMMRPWKSKTSIAIFISGSGLFRDSGWSQPDRNAGVRRDAVYLHRVRPVVFITGAARSLFVPMAMAVVFAMLTSYFLSRTLVPR